MRTGCQVLITGEIPVPSFRQARGVGPGIEDSLRTVRAGQLAAVNLSLPGDGRIDARFDGHMAPGSAGVPTMGSQQ